LAAPCRKSWSISGIPTPQAAETHSFVTASSFIHRETLSAKSWTWSPEESSTLNPFMPLTNRGMQTCFRHNLIEVRGDSREAIFTQLDTKEEVVMKPSRKWIVESIGTVASEEGLFATSYGMGWKGLQAVRVEIPDGQVATARVASMICAILGR
jgi:hypothetical protein